MRLLVRTYRVVCAELAVVQYTRHRSASGWMVIILCFWLIHPRLSDSSSRDFSCVQLTTSRIGNLTRLIHTLAICVTIRAGAPTATRTHVSSFFLSFVSLEVGLFPSIFVPLPFFSLYGEYVVRFFLQGRVFRPCDQGRLCEIQSINQAVLSSHQKVVLRRQKCYQVHI